MAKKMSKVEVRDWAWTLGDSPVQRLVSVALAEYVNEAKGYAWPSVTELVDRTGLHRDTIMTAVAALEESGAWTVERRNGSGNKYFPVLDYTPTSRTDRPVGENDRSEKPTGPVGETDGTSRTDRHVTGKNHNEQVSKNPPADAAGDLDALFAPYEPATDTPKVKTEKRTKKDPAQVSSNSAFAWATVEKCAAVAAGLVRNRKQLHDTIITAIEQGGHDPEQVAATCFAISAAQKPISLAFLYDVLLKRRNADGSFINKSSGPARPGMPLNADKRDESTPRRGIFSESMRIDEPDDKPRRGIYEERLR